ANGVVLSARTEDIASGFLLAERTVAETDAAGRPTLTLFEDGTYESFVYACCGLLSRTGRDGLTTVYDYDSLGRTEITTTAAGTPAQQVSKTVLDAAGNSVAEYIGPDLSDLRLVAEYDYNPAGEATAVREPYLDAAPAESRETLHSLAYDP